MLNLIKNLFTLNVALAGKIKAQQVYNEALALHGAKEYRKALPLMEEAAKLGLPEAQSVLGSMWLLGQGTRENGKLAIQYLTAAYEAGYKPAGSILGMAYVTGKAGVTIDMEVGTRFLEEAVASGDHQSEEMLSMIRQRRGMFARDNAKRAK